MLQVVRSRFYISGMRAVSAVATFTVPHESHVSGLFFLCESFFHQLAAEKVGVVGIQPEGDGDDNSQRIHVG